MEPIYSQKREGAVYIPYRIRSDGTPEYFLQKRDMNAPTHAGIFSMFGGEIEAGENPLGAVLREVEEELTIVPAHPLYVTRAERSTTIFHLFTEEVGDQFEKTVDVREGEFGAFMTLAEAKTQPVSAICLSCMTDIDEWLDARP